MVKRKAEIPPNRVPLSFISAQETARRLYERGRLPDAPRWGELPLNAQSSLVEGVLRPVREYLKVFNERHYSDSGNS